MPVGRSSAPLSASVRLRSRTVSAGSSLPGRVVVQNNTGHAIRVPGCGALFQVALASARYQPAVAWPTCLQMLTIPAGESSYPVTVLASYLQCHEGRTQGAIRACLPDQRPPPLPPGDYRARLFQVGHLVVAPPGTTVRVTAPLPGQGGQVRYRRG